MARTHKKWVLQEPEFDILKYPDNWQAHAQTIMETDSIVTTDSKGRKIVKAGTVYPANDETARGIVHHDYYLDFGDVDVDVVFEGVVIEERLVEPLTEEAQAKLPRITVEKATTKIPRELP